jgi:hypothetical protein
MQRELVVAPGGQDDWIVKEDGGRELGHYPTQQEAEAVGRKLAQKRKADLLVRDPAGRIMQSPVRIRAALASPRGR